jgi:uncharacterized membrane protein
MMHSVQTFAEWGAAITEVVGLGVILVMALYALAYALVQLVRRREGHAVFVETRHRLIRGILLGLEFLVAADIIHTVAVDLTFTSVGVLAIIVLIRTFLSFSLEVEMTGRWPWQPRTTNGGKAAS